MRLKIVKISSLKDGETNMTVARPPVRSAIIKKASSVKIHFANQLKGVRIDEPTVVTSARVAVTPPTTPLPVSDPCSETVIEFALPAGTKLSSVRPEPSKEAQQKNTLEKQQIERVIGQLREKSDTLFADRQERLQQWQTAAVELAASMATKLLHKEISSGEFRYDEMIRDMVSQMGDDVPLTVRLHPEDVEILEHRLNGEPLLSRDRDPRVVPDIKLERGEVRIDGKESVLVSNVTRQLQTIRSELLRSLGNARS